jgi:iron complex outermembrane receptor protein
MIKDNNRYALITLGFVLAFLPLDKTFSAEKDNAHELEEIIVLSTRNQLGFDQQPSRVEILGDEEIQEKANMKPGDIRMLLNEITGIHVQQTSAITFNSSIRMQGLDGKYTQLLRDGMPLFGGFSAGLGLLQIAPLDLKQVEVVKGANSTLYGGGAIAGLVNLITKKPQIDPETSILLNLTSSGGIDVSGFHSSRHDQMGATIFTSYNKSDPYDPSDTGLTAIPKFNRWTFSPKIFLTKLTSEISFGLNASRENRIGGDMGYITEAVDQHEFFQKVDTNRLSTQLEYIVQLGQGREFFAKNSFNYYQQNLSSKDYLFEGSQFSSFTELHVRGTSTLFDWVIGANAWTDSFDQEIPETSSALDFDSQIVGAFAQGTFLVSDSWSFESGLRFDSTSDYGTFLLPRISVMYTPDGDTTLRFSSSLGYKTPTPFSSGAENRQYRNVLPIDANDLKAEESSGFNIDVNKRFTLDGNASVNLNLLVFNTQVDNPLRLLPSDDDYYEYSQPDDFLNSRGAEISLIWKWNDLKYFFGYTHADVKVHTGIGIRMAPLMPKNRINNILVYEIENKLRVGLEAYYYGHQELTDGTKTRDFWIFGLMVEKSLNESSSIFLNFENFTDTRQTRFGPIFAGPKLAPEYADIYAPLDGFVINGGIKFKFR